jgi:hypothetical protein
MQKTFRFENRIFSVSKKYFDVPDKCLTMAIVNGGSSEILIDDAVQLKPGQTFSFPQVTGYYLHQKVKIQVVTGTGTFADTKIRIRLALENQ